MLFDSHTVLVVQQRLSWISGVKKSTLSSSANSRISYVAYAALRCAQFANVVRVDHLVDRGRGGDWTRTGPAMGPASGVGRIGRARCVEPCRRVCRLPLLAPTSYVLGCLGDLGFLDPLIEDFTTGPLREIDGFGLATGFAVAVATAEVVRRRRRRSVVLPGRLLRPHPTGYGC